MKRIAQILAAMTLLAWTGTARAADSPFYTAFQTLCAAHRGAAGPALAAADAAGWATLNSAMVPIPQTGAFKLEHYDVRLHASATGKVIVLLVGAGEAMTGAGAATPADICMLISKPADSTAIAEAQSWVSVPFTMAQGTLKAFLYSDTAQGHEPLPLTDYKAALGRDAVNIVLIGDAKEAGVSILGFMRPKSGG